ncbi:MBL fold metallo-hydrolase [Nocardia cyriacigeorgica]|uniref:alkyl/aryl-sulfatase n=1 Tax=Nocardia cyriacigeorgica TaxID=135487 RepID=UPI001895DAA8|nr:alkyl sulfatase dimerization domain-containing protein [Nocardia cyriacigeorgica]MBF6101072.1 MBL fold metallo-hydrolase [Nocardia cyriacigeorgica]MBF6160484.1 MBL fold metallo-hydrolase [Nocardia cyriacigeorgica]MBF6199749.1 MBL fold metallo-hydrolase [Nocardia cyriacigeorgica]
MTTNPDFDDTTDFDNADRGFIEALDQPEIRTSDGRTIWDTGSYAFLSGECPPTANPSLWRQGQLCNKQGLFEVTEGVYQVRNLDLSNMTLVEGDSGVIVIDPLISAETAAAALALYRRCRGDRPVTGLIYTHSHVDHFGGARGVVPEGHAPVPVLAPSGFLEHAVSENVYAGNAMTRRAIYMYGVGIDKAPDGQIGCGLGMTTSTGTVTLIPPTVDITHTGQVEEIDGVRIVFQLTPGTEAPAEMNFLFPDRRALCMAENATHNMHNVLTLRGALVRDSRIWAHYLDEAIAMFADKADVAFASHHWPTWGSELWTELLAGQRDMYAYLHDQTLRLTNRGLTGPEIAEELSLPHALDRAWANRGYYGSLSHNVKAVYQRYMGWFDGNPAHLWEHPQAELAKRYVADYGGVDAVIAKGREYAERGDLRFAATLLNHAVFAEPGDDTAKQTLAEVYDKLGHGAENGTWRNFFLVAAHELRHGVTADTVQTADPAMMSALTVDMLIDSLAVRIDGPRAADKGFTMDWKLTDQDRTVRLTLSNGALTHRTGCAQAPLRGPADLTLTMTKPQLVNLLLGKDEGVAFEGDRSVLSTLIGLLDAPDTHFPIVTP